VVASLADQPSATVAKMPLKITSLHEHIVTQLARDFCFRPARCGSFATSGDRQVERFCVDAHSLTIQLLIRCQHNP
jgi:hypothetical protein